jgi:biotin carboxylase
MIPFKNVMHLRAGKATIIKPVDNSGSRGVLLITDDSDMQHSYNYASKHSISGTVIIEDFMESPEVSVETLTVGGVTKVIAITDKLTTGAPYFVEIGHSVPSQLPISTKEAITRLAIKAIKALDIKSGPTHTEIIVTKDGPKIVEIGARLGGGYITTHLVPLATGVNLVENCIKIALGETPCINHWDKTLGSSIRYLTPRQGRVLSINGVERAKNMRGVVEMQLSFKVGDIISPITDCSKRVGYVIAKADTPEEACKICEDALTSISIEFE